MLYFLTRQKLGHRMGFLRIVLIHTAFLAEIGVIDARGNRRSGRDRILNGSWGRHVVLLSMWVRTGQDVFGLLLFLHIEQANAMAEAAMSRATGAARASSFRTASYVSLLNGASTMAGMQQQQDFFALQEQYRQKTLAS